MRSIIVFSAVTALVACQQAPEAMSNDTASVMPDAKTAGTPVPAAPVAGRVDYSDAGKQQAWISRGQDAIRAKLSDPDSARFRDVAFHSGGGVPLACGQVNANNGFGGKSGYERFIAAGTTLTVLESEMTSSSDMDSVWDRFCRD